jgi:glycosyltransferase involved in cell wall biosynthesis
MRFFGILVVRDEADIIERTLRHVDDWCDGVYVYDTGSVDGTWEIVRKAGSELSSVHPIERAEVQFDDTIRAYVFNRVRDRFDDGDWILRLDGDEFYEIPPPTFVQRYVRSYETAVYKETYEFRFTKKDLKGWQGQRREPATERLKYFEVLDWVEPRMFRYRSSMAWPEDTYGPINAGYVARCRIPVRHYPHRSPRQMHRRCVLRSFIANETDDVGGHWKEDRWHDLVADDIDALRRWTADTTFSVPCDGRHTASPSKRALKYVLHRFLVQGVDWMRSSFPEDYAPAPLPTGFQERLRSEYDADLEEIQIK